jgi:hypothetical protein
LQLVLDVSPSRVVHLDALNGVIHEDLSTTLTPLVRIAEDQRRTFFSLSRFDPFFMWSQSQRGLQFDFSPEMFVFLL